MKALDEYILMVVLALLLKRVKCDHSNESYGWVHSNGSVRAITERSQCLTKPKRDLHSPVYSGRLEYIRWYTRFIDALLGVTGISGFTHHDTHKTYLIYPLIAVSENTWSFDYFWHPVSL